MFELALSYVDDILILITILVGSIALSVWVRRVVRGYLSRFAPNISGVFATLIQVLVILLGVFISVWVTGVSGGVILTVIAILSAGVSLALDDSAKDGIAGIKILVFGYVKVGDYVKLLDRYEGTVAATDLFTVTLSTRSREAVIIPNGRVVGTVVINRSIITGQAVDVLLPLRRDYDHDLAMQIMSQVAVKVDEQYGDHVFDPEVKFINITDFDNWRVRVYASDDVSLSEIRHVLTLDLSKQLGRAGIHMGQGLDFTITHDATNGTLQPDIPRDIRALREAVSTKRSDLGHASVQVGRAGDN